MNFPKFHGGTAPPTVVIDFDGTLAVSHWPDPRAGTPIQSGVDAVEHYFAQGLEIVIYTARPESHRRIVEAWLQYYGLADKIHDVVLGKPRGFIYIDDRAFNPDSNAWEARAEQLGDDARDARAADVAPDSWEDVG